MKQILHYILFLLSITLLISCSGKAEVKEENKQFVLSDTMQKMIQLSPAISDSIDNTLTLSGEVSFDENNVVKIFPRSSGQVLNCKISLGDKVSQGQTLAIIRSADIAGSYSDLSSANADINITKRQMDNTAALYKSGIASEKEYTEAKQNYQKALAAKQKIQSILNINAGNSTKPGGTYILAAPISGYIVEKKINAGNFIRQDMGDNLFTISNLKDVWVWANVFEADIAKVQEGSEVQVTTLAYPDKIFKGKIDKLSQVLDPTNKALKVRIRLDNTNLLLRPEMFAKVIVSSKEATKAICIPTQALISQNGKDYVVIYNNKADIKIAEVNILKTVGDKTYINSGVEAGQQLIIKNQLLIFQQLLNE